MRVGSLVYATEQGLGVLAKSLYDAGIITDVLIVAHGKFPERDWYPGSPRLNSLRSDWKTVTDFVSKMDTMFFLETPFVWSIIPHCKKVGVRTVLMPMYECMPRQLPHKPDAYINPSKLDQQYYPEGRFIPVPSPMKWRLRERATTFVHNAGHGGLKGRNGTTELLRAWKKVTSPAHLIVRSQVPIDSPLSFGHTARVTHSAKFEQDRGKILEFRIGNFPYDELFEEGDVFVFPERFNGLSLPLQEAHASGMMVMCLDRFPMNDWLPQEPLIPVEGYRNSSVSPRCHLFKEAMTSPELIAQTIDRWYGRDITAFSRLGKLWAQTVTWESVCGQYMEVLRG